MSSECPRGENSANTPEVPYQTPRLWLRKSARCTPYRGSVSNTDKRLSGGFHTQFAGSPLFAEATLSYRPTRAGATTTTTHLNAPAVLSWLYSMMNRFPDRATWRRRTLRSNIGILKGVLQFVKATGRLQPGEKGREVEAGVEEGVEIEQ